MVKCAEGKLEKINNGRLTVIMKKTFISFILLICMVSMLFSCGGGDIPNGTYVHTGELFGDLTFDTKYVIKDELFLKVYGFENDNYTIYEQYKRELKEDKTEITLTFEKFVYSGSDMALSMINLLNSQLNDPELAGAMPTRGPVTYSFEIGNGYFVLDGIRYDKQK